MRFASFIFLATFFCVLFTSCRTNRALYNYLEDVKDTSFRKNVYIAEPIIQKNDLLAINIHSASLNPGVDAMYNMGGQLQVGPNGQPIGAGYLVDVYGYIEMPKLGKIKAEGLKKSELEAAIREKLEGQLNNANVIIRYLNFKIMVLGEVRSPGVLNINSERLTVLEAIGMVGGIAPTGTIKNVKVLREYNGERQLGVLDLTSKEIFSSPYYQMQQNDVVLVDQTPYKLRVTEQQRVSQQIGFITGLISTVALVIAIFNR